MGKTSKSKQKQKLESPLFEVSQDDNSGYTADFFNEEQLQELKQQESKQKILEHLKKQGMLGKQTYKDVKIQLRKKFGPYTINIHKNWLVATFNSRKADSKLSTPANKKKTNIKMKFTKITPIQAGQNNDDTSNKSITSLTSLKNENQTNTIGIDLQSLQSDLENTESELSQIQSDTTFSELNQIEELIEKKFGELTSKAWEELNQRLLQQNPDVLKTPLFLKLTDQIEEAVGKVTMLESQINVVDLQEISRQVADGKDEIQQTFQFLVEDIKKVAPTLGVATQESLARNVRRINEQFGEMHKILQDSSLGFLQTKEQLQTMTNQNREQVNGLQNAVRDIEKKLKCVVDTFNDTIEDCKDNITKNMNLIHESIKTVSTRVKNFERHMLKQKSQQMIPVQLQQSQSKLMPQLQQEQAISSNMLNTNINFQDTIMKYNQHDPRIKFIKIGNKNYLHDTNTKHIILIEDEVDN